MNTQWRRRFRLREVVIDWVNAQPLAPLLTYIGDGHDGIWNIITRLAPESQRREVFDWFHLMENLYKVGDSIKRLQQAENLLWQGQVDAARVLFADCKLKQAQNFCEYLDKHHQLPVLSSRGDLLGCSGVNHQAN
jgi:hypothetical protein